ncbi:MAG: helix-turn-helix domain-containing protein [Nitrospira sp.]|nr:helix-turn-helix domain-containing protein [Nitrospira sp.]
MNIERRKSGFSRFPGIYGSLRRSERGEVAAQRMKIIKFYEKYGEKATIKAYGTNRKVINRWRKRLKHSGGNPIALVPLSTRPRRVRKSIVPREIIEFIKVLRRTHPRLGKEKIKPLLDEYCRSDGMKSVSESTIGNIIRRHHLFYKRRMGSPPVLAVNVLKT